MHLSSENIEIEALKRSLANKDILIADLTFQLKVCIEKIAELERRLK